LVVVTAATSATTSSNNATTTTTRTSLAGADPLSLDPLSDPLSGLALDAGDPLGASVQQAQRIQSNDDSARQAALESHQNELHTPWQIQKARILKEYAVVGNLQLSSEAINEFEGSGVEDGSATRHLDRYAERLANLERRHFSTAKVELTQKQYEEHVNRLSNDLNRAWKNDERVASLKIAIQLAKLLSDTNMPQFYPTMFVLVTDVLERFGDMVFTRLRNKSEEALNEDLPPGRKRMTLPELFAPSEVPQAAKETCRNWFYKIACIRELLPRAYVEITLLKCYRFLTDSDFPQILSRLGSILRGLGDPLVSLYARTYLVMVGNDVCPSLNNYALPMLQDAIFSFRMLGQEHHLSELQRLKFAEKDYIRLLSPGVEWVLKYVGRTATREVFQSILQQFREHCNDAMVLRHIIESFDGSHYAHGAVGMAQLVKQTAPSSVTHVDVFAALGKQLAVFPPPEEQRLPLLNEVWKVVGKCDKIGSYVRCSSAWLDVVSRHYSEKEMLVLLSDLSSKLEANQGKEYSDATVRQLENLLTSLLSSKGNSAGSSSSAAVLTSDHLLKILDVFKGSRKVGLCKVRFSRLFFFSFSSLLLALTHLLFLSCPTKQDILEAFKRLGTTNDAVLINTMFDIGRTLHDSVDLLSSDGDRRHIAGLLCGFIDKIDYGKDLEQQLNVYVECRAIFCNLDLVKDKLVLRVSELAVKAYRFMRGKHSKKTAAFAKACLAFCHITTPSIGDVSRKLQLLLHCANVALLNQCLPQTDTFLKAAISLVPDVPPYEDVDGKRVHTEDRLCSFVRSLLSTLVIAPGHPDHGPFYIVQGLLNALPKYPWQQSTGAMTRLYIDMLALLATYAQRRFPYHVPHVESNDDLYGGAPGYVFELRQVTHACLQEVLKQLTTLGERTELQSKLAQSRLLLDFANCLASHFAITQELVVFLLKILGLATQVKGSFTRSDMRYLANTVDFLKQKASSKGDQQAPEMAALREGLKAFA